MSLDLAHQRPGQIRIKAVKKLIQSSTGIRLGRNACPHGRQRAIVRHHVHTFRSWSDTMLTPFLLLPTVRATMALFAPALPGTRCWRPREAAIGRLRIGRGALDCGGICFKLRHVFDDERFPGAAPMVSKGTC